MSQRIRVLRRPTVLAAAFFAVACTESVGPERPSPGAPLYDAAANGGGIALDQQNSALGTSGTRLIKGFNPVNPQVGDAIIATFFWLGSTNIITSVTDHLTDPQFTPVGNAYTLVEYVAAGGVSMATYVATNVQNIPVANANQDNIYAVQGNLSEPVTDGGIMISAWKGVGTLSPHAVRAHRSASGFGSSPVAAAPGAVPIGAGALAYGVTLANTLVGLDVPQGFTNVTNGSLADAVMKADGEYAVQASAGSVDPTWTWFFDETRPGTWLASVLVLDPPLHLGYAVQPSTTLPLLTIQPPVQVAVLDALGNRVTTFNGTVTIAIGRNGGVLAPGTLSGTKTVTVVNGVAAFSDLSVDQPGNGYTLVVSAAGVVGAESAPFNIGL